MRRAALPLASVGLLGLAPTRTASRAWPRAAMLALLAACRPEAASRDQPPTREPPASPAARPRPTAEVSAQPSASPSAASAASASPSAASASARSGPCVIQILSVLEARVWRGPGALSPASQRVRDALSPGERARWEGRDHGLLHLRCRYSVAMNGKRYRHDHIAGQHVGFDVNGKLDPALCERARREVEQRLVETTRGCADPHAGANWGVDLIEAP